MTKGPVQIEMEGLLAAAFPGADFTLSNDSAQHRGPSGDDGRGESHFSLPIAWAGFAGQHRVAPPRAVTKAPGRPPHPPAPAHDRKTLASGKVPTKAQTHPPTKK